MEDTTDTRDLQDLPQQHPESFYDHQSNLYRFVSSDNVLSSFRYSQSQIHQQIGVETFLSNPNLLIIDNNKSDLMEFNPLLKEHNQLISSSSSSLPAVDTDSLFIALAESLDVINHPIPCKDDVNIDSQTTQQQNTSNNNSLLSDDSAISHLWNSPVRLAVLLLSQISMNSMTAAASFASRLLHSLPSSLADSNNSNSQSLRHPDKPNHLEQFDNQDYPLLNSNSNHSLASAFSPDERFVMPTNDDVTFGSSSTSSTCVSERLDRHNHNSTFGKNHQYSSEDVDEFLHDDEEVTLREHLEVALAGMTESFMNSRGVLMVSSIMELFLRELGRLQNTITSMSSVIGRLQDRLETATTRLNQAGRELQDALESKRKLELWIQSITQYIRLPVGYSSSTKTNQHHVTDNKQWRRSNKNARHSTSHPVLQQVVIPSHSLFIPPPPPPPLSCSSNVVPLSTVSPPPPPPPPSSSSSTSHHHHHFIVDQSPPISRSVRRNHSDVDNVYQQHYKM